MNVVQVHGIRTYSYHGCLEEEKDSGGNYIVDIEVFSDLLSSLTSSLDGLIISFQFFSIMIALYK